MNTLILTNLRPEMERFGTERVAHNLASQWQSLGHHVTVAGHTRSGAPPIPGNMDGYKVHAFQPLMKPTREEYFSRRSRSVSDLSAMLKVEPPDVALVVGFGSSEITISHIEELRAFGVPVALWHHVPGITCQQHGLRYKDREPCNGFVEARRCAACRLTAAGMPEVAAEIAARLPQIEASGVSGALGHFLEARRLSCRFSESVKILADKISHTFVGADWVQELLELNGFPAARVSVVRPGVPAGLMEQLSLTDRTRPKAESVVRFAYWGRIDDTKGIDTAIRAVRTLQVPLEFQIAGPIDASSSYHRELLNLSDGDHRISFVGLLDTPKLAQFLRDADVAIIPSMWPETGPLTVFEAHAAGLPIIGARTGGIAEICADDRSAMLFERGDHVALARIVGGLAIDATSRCALVEMSPLARTMSDVASEMLDVLGTISNRS